MNVQERKPVRDFKSRDSSPTPHTDVEVGTIDLVELPTTDGDAALRFLKGQQIAGVLTPEDEKKLVRKIDWMIMPLMWGCYCLQYLDKTLGKLSPSPCAAYSF